MKKITLPITILFLVFRTLSIAQTLPGICDTGNLVAQETSTSLPLELDGAGDMTIDCENDPNILIFDIAETGIIGSTTSLSQVVFDIEHTWSGDLEISLVSPAGTSIILTDNNSGDTDDAYSNTVFADGGEDITTATPPYTNLLAQPQGGNFADVFDGESITGTWELRICDTAAGDTGAVIFAGIVFCNPIAPPPPNDLIENAIDVDEAGFPFIDAAVNFPTVTEEVIPNESNCATGGAVPAVWYKFTATEEDTATATITTPASDNSNAIVIFYNAPNEDATLDDLTFENSGTNECPNTITTSIETTVGQTYYLLVININTVSDVTIDLDTLSTDDNVFEGFSFFPNPVENVLNLQATQTIDQVSLYNISGQKVLDQTINATTRQLQVGNLTGGIYLMTVTSGNSSATYKVIKK